MPKQLPIQVIYASTSGNVEAVVEQLAITLRQAGFVVELHRSEKTSIEVLTRNTLFVLATSTWEHGALNPFFLKLAEEMKSVQFSGKWAAFIGLGDRRYEPVMFCEGMEKLRRLWLKNQGQELQEPLKINGEPYGLLDSTVMPWSAKLAASFESSSVQPSLVMRIKKWLSHD